MKNSLIILVFFALGILLGYVDVLPRQVVDGNYSKYVLLVLMFLVGFSVAIDSKKTRFVKSIDLKVFISPVVCIVGTYLGCFVLSLFINELSLIDLLTVGSGFAYYSLSSILIAEAGHEKLAVIALLANILREISTLLFAPLMVKYFGKLAPIVSGGATSMDTSLPIITQTSGKEFVFIAIINGIVLEICVPLFVSLFLAVG
ncbi:MAG: lysine exporter LysO family protein [Bacteroidales bacterium]